MAQQTCFKTDYTALLLLRPAANGILA